MVTVLICPGGRTGEEYHIYHISLVIRQSFFPSQTIPKFLDPSYKIDLDLWDCLGRIKLVL